MRAGAGQAGFAAAGTKSFQKAVGLQWHLAPSRSSRAYLYKGSCVKARATDGPCRPSAPRRPAGTARMRYFLEHPRQRLRRHLLHRAQQLLGRVLRSADRLLQAREVLHRGRGQSGSAWSSVHSRW